MDASKLLQQLAQVGSLDTHVAMLLLCQCGSFSRLMHLARSIPPSLAGDALGVFGDEVRQCYREFQVALDSWLGGPRPKIPSLSFLCVG